jgi:drug/metabolite transporter (DMT)-like permease
MNKSNQEKIFTNPVYVLLLSLLCTILWGSAFPSIKIGYQLFHLTPDDISGKFVFAGLRFFLAGLFVIVINSLKCRKLLLPKKQNIKGILIVSFFLTVLEYVFFYISMSHTGGVKGAIIDSSGFFFVVILAHFFYKNDRFTRNKTIGCLLGFLGIVLVNLKGLSAADFSFNILGDGFMLLSALFFAIGSLLSKNVCAKEDAAAVTGYQLGIGGLILIILGLTTGGTLPVVNMSGVLLLTYMASLSAVAFTLWTILSKYNKISRIAVYNFLTPVFGTFLSSLFLGESLFTWYNLTALILVCTGIYIVNSGTYSSYGNSSLS